MHRLRRLVPSANYLFVFEAAARRKSFSAAAKELNVSQPAVSKTIKMLEEAIGLKLFERRHKWLELTGDGQRIFEETQKSFDELYLVISSIQQKNSNDVVRVSFSASFIHLWLLPRLKSFNALYPGVSLRIEESSREDHDLNIEDIDLSSRRGTGNWPGLDARHFVTDEIWPVCSPTYLRERGPIAKPADLLKQTLLHVHEPHRSRIGWREWLERNGVTVTRLPQVFMFTEVQSSMEAALLGQGIALGWKHLILDHVKSGQLVRAIDIRFRSGQSYYLVSSAERPPKQATIAFRDWLLRQNAEADPFASG